MKIIFRFSALLGILCLLLFPAAGEAPADRELVFAEPQVIAGVGASLVRAPEVRRLTEDAPAETPRLLWESTNPQVASVDLWGQVNCIAPGSTRITARAEDDPRVAGGYDLYVVRPVESITPVTPEVTLILEPTGSRDETDLFYTIQPADAWWGRILWSASDPAVVRVDETGHVQAVAPGHASVTAAAAQLPVGGTVPKKAVFRITVLRQTESVTLSQAALTLPRGGYASLQATVGPRDASDKNVLWTSSDPAVATVSASGRVWARGSGTAEIRCEARDGGAYALCAVTVNWPVQSVRLGETRLTLSPGESRSLSAAVAPADADNPAVTWASSNPRIAAVSAEGLVTAELGGDCVISCEAADGSGCRAEAQVHVPAFHAESAAWTVDAPEGITVPLLWHSFEPVALELSISSPCFRASWDAEGNIRLQPLQAGTGILTIDNPLSAADRTNLQITVTPAAVTDPLEYPDLSYALLLQGTTQVGARGRITGRVLQRVDQETGVILRVGTAGEDWSGEAFWVEYAAGAPVAEAREGNLVLVCGIYKGIYTYGAADGTEVSVPALEAQKILVR